MEPSIAENEAVRLDTVRQSIASPSCLSGAVQTNIEPTTKMRVTS